MPEPGAATTTGLPIALLHSHKRAEPTSITAIEALVGTEVTHPSAPPERVRLPSFHRFSYSRI